MLFILLFGICAMALPISMDIHKNGKNNILNRAWEDIVKSDVAKYAKAKAKLKK